jgi:hypothetical protein
MNWNTAIIQIDNRESHQWIESKDMPEGRLYMNTWQDSWHDKDREAMGKSGYPSNEWAPWDMSRLLNQVQAKRLGMEYKWISVSKDYVEPSDRHYTWLKIKKLRELVDDNLASGTNKCIVFLDSDAFIRCRDSFKKTLSEFLEGQKEFYISLDVPRPRNSKVNSGFIMMKVTENIKNFLKDVWDNVDNVPGNMRREFPHEQRVIDYILGKEQYKNIVEYPPTTTWANSPIGEMVRHCWYHEFMGPVFVDQAFCLLAEELVGDESIPPVLDTQHS